MSRKIRQDDSYEDIMAATAEDISEPELYPEGPWTIQNVGFSATDVEDDQRGEQKLINLRYTGFEPGESVDPELALKGGFEGRTLWVRRYISKPLARGAKDGTLARFVKFVRMHGVDTEGLNVDQMCKALKGAMARATIGTRTYEKDGETIRDNTVSDFAALEQE